jgi:D-glycero-D-manno-heptose 1,7-bisphosphate phosphatase
MDDIKKYSTLFLDRDGVINVQRLKDYVKSPDEFVFMDGAVEALKELSPLFMHIVITSNQRGVGRGLMSNKDLEEVHRFMLETISHGGGRIDKIYVCADIDDASPNRKPNIGMIIQSQRDFPDIDLSNSWMVGDSISDIQFAENAHVPFALVGNKYSEEELATYDISMQCQDLFTFAKIIKKNIVS